MEGSVKLERDLNHKKRLQKEIGSTYDEACKTEILNSFNIMEESQISIHVIEGKNFKVELKEKIGRRIRLTYQDNTVQTAHYETQGYNHACSWLETFLLPVSRADYPIKVEYVQRERGRQRVAGGAQIFLAGFMDQKRHDSWFDLGCGKVRLAIRFVHSKVKFYSEILDKLDQQITDIERQLGDSHGQRPQPAVIAINLNLKRVSDEANKLRQKNSAKKIQRWFRERQKEHSFDTFRVNDNTTEGLLNALKMESRDLSQDFESLDIAEASNFLGKLDNLIQEESDDFSVSVKEVMSPTSEMLINDSVKGGFSEFDMPEMDEYSSLQISPDRGSNYRRTEKENRRPTDTAPSPPDESEIDYEDEETSEAANQISLSDSVEEESDISEMTHSEADFQSQADSDQIMKPPIRTPPEIAPSLDEARFEEPIEQSLVNSNVVSDNSEPESDEASLSDAANVISDESSEEEEEEEDESEEEEEDEPSEASSVADSVSKRPKRFAQLRRR